MKNSKILKKRKIRPYTADFYPKVFKQAETEVLTTTSERSFWEKATILHQEVFRPEGSLIPARYSRHYYDLYCTSNSSVKTEALKQPELLKEVADFKQKFYPRNWALYNLARVGTLKLVPAEHSIPDIKEDYSKMRSMIYGSYPDFDAIMKCLENLENEINK